MKNVPAQTVQQPVESASNPVASIKFDMHSQRRSSEMVSKNWLSEMGSEERSGYRISSLSCSTFRRRLNIAASNKKER